MRAHLLLILTIPGEAMNHENIVKQRLKNGENVIGSFVKTTDPAVMKRLPWPVLISRGSITNIPA